MKKVQYKDATLVCCLGHICIFSKNGSSLVAYYKQSFREVMAYSEGIHKNVSVTLYYYKNMLQCVEVLRQDKVSLFDGIFKSTF